MVSLRHLTSPLLSRLPSSCECEGPGCLLPAEGPADRQTCGQHQLPGSRIHGGVSSHLGCLPLVTKNNPHPPSHLSPRTSDSNEGVYNLLLDRGADPDAQDTYGNTVLHMVVVASQLGMYGYALRHPRKNANPYIKNQRGLTCLTLSCELGRDTIFREMLELSCTEFWRYSNITCCGYPLGALDSIQPDGQTSQC